MVTGGWSAEAHIGPGRILLGPGGRLAKAVRGTEADVIGMATHNIVELIKNDFVIDHTTGVRGGIDRIALQTAKLILRHGTGQLFAPFYLRVSRLVGRPADPAINIRWNYITV